MLMDINCAAQSSMNLKLLFDDQSTKEANIAIGDLIDVTWNGNGLRKHIIGKVINIQTVGTRPEGWYFIVDGSDDFAGQYAKIAPMTVLDINILRKGATDGAVLTPIGDTGIPYIRVYQGQFQISKDGCRWYTIVYLEDIIKPADGPGTNPPHPGPHPGPHPWPPIPPCPPIPPAPTPIYPDESDDTGEIIG